MATHIISTPAFVSLHRKLWAPGVISTGLAGLACVLLLVGYRLAHPTNPNCPVTEVWRGMMIALFALAIAVPGALCGLVGIGWTKANRVLGLLGLVSHIGFATM